ncbi:MAG: efflux RND transporter periplasmic adaptor subunit, partial [Bacteroidetes bacterium]|nr:efflux RND transporter periplasmic adaptor subunit [Bacteroidota bacterium]
LMAKKEMISEIEYFNSKTNYQYLKKKHALTQLRVQEDQLYRQTQLNRIDQSIELMERNLEAIRANLDNLVVKAPMDGQLNSFDHEEGESKVKGSSLGRIDQLGEFKITAMVDQYYLNRIKVGQKATFAYGDKDFELTIAKVSPTVTGSQFEVELHFTEQVPANLTRGQLFQLKISLSAVSESVLIPKGGFYQSTGGTWVFVIDTDGNGHKRNIKLGRQNITHIEVLEGLEPGDQVLISNYESFLEIEQLKLK